MKFFSHPASEHTHSKFLYKNAPEGGPSSHDKISHTVGQASKITRAVSYPTRKVFAAVDNVITRLPGGRALRLPVVGADRLTMGAFKAVEKGTQAVLETGSQALTRGVEIAANTVWNTTKAVGKVLAGKNHKNNDYLGVSGLATGTAKGLTLRDSVLSNGEKSDLSRSKVRGKIERKADKAHSETRKSEWNDFKSAGPESQPKPDAEPVSEATPKTEPTAA